LFKYGGTRILGLMGGEEEKKASGGAGAQAQEQTAGAKFRV